MDRPRSRAVVAGAGAGGSLAAATACIFALGSATVAFLQPPADTLGQRGGSVTLALPQREPRDVRKTAPRVARPRPRPPVARVVPQPRRTASQPARRRVREGRVRPVGGGVPAPSAPAAPQPPPPPPAATPGPQPEPAPTVLRGRVEQAAGDVRETGEGTPVEVVTETAAATVEQVARLLP